MTCKGEGMEKLPDKKKCLTAGAEGSIICKA